MNRLDSLVLLYKENKSELTFNEIYAIISDKYFGKEAQIAKRLSIDELELIALQDDKLIEAINAYDASKGDFEKYYSVALANGRKRVGKRAGKLRERETSIASYGDEPDDVTFDRIRLQYDTEAATEGVPIDEILAIKKEEDQRQLILSLVQNVDFSTTVIVREILSDRSLKRDINATAIAKVAKIDRSRIKRKLHRLRKNYDSNRFGDYRDYLCV